MMKLATCIAIVGSIALAQSLIIDTFEPTFLDSIYGDLVSTPASREYKLQMLDQGLVGRYVKSPHLGMDGLNNFEINNFNDLQAALEQYHWVQKSSLDQQYNDAYYEKSHESYVKYQSKLRLPDDDDTNDIRGGLNMFGGIVTFARFPHYDCFDPKLYDQDLDIAIVGAPFDTGVSFRPGARFGPNEIRQASRRLGGMTLDRGRLNQHSQLPLVNPYDKATHNLTIIDCGDVPMTPFDNRIALNQLYRGHRSIHKHGHHKRHHHKIPKIIMMGGDHTVTLMALRLVYEHHGPVSVIHFDSHIDTWDPKVLGGGLSHYMSLNHGTFLHYAAEQGYLIKDKCYHVGMRAPMIASKRELDHDHYDCGFNIITARDMDKYGPVEIARQLKEAVGNNPVYISVDIDVLDPAHAPATGTMESGGWTTRELLNVLDGLEGINLVGADVVEVSPPFDSRTGTTSLAATSVIDSFLGLLIVRL